MTSITEPAFQSDFLRTLQARGYIHQITHPAAAWSPATSASTPPPPRCTSAA
jgi:tyrosyl-tRNA synthetase